MKKTISVLFAAAALVFLAAGCAKKSTQAKPVVGFVYIGSINDVYTGAHDKGRVALQTLGYECHYVENVAENTADVEKAIHDLIDQGCTVIYTTSFGFMDATVNVAKEYPDLKFAHCSGYKQEANMSRYFGKIYQPRYLSGIAAGYKTTANKIGYVAAYSIPEVIRGINAFTLGVRSVNPDAVVEVVWTNTWYDPAVEKQAALELLNRGCDIIAQHQDTTAPQIAAQERGAFAIGYDMPSPAEAPKAYLTAPIFNWDVFYIDDVQQIEAGTWQSRAYWEGLAAGAVGLDTLSANNDPRAEAAIVAVTASIIEGSFDPFTGPIKDQAGEVRVAPGVRLTDDEIWSMNWFVEGVRGTIAE
ncbi:MAG: BMP family ABC transporter substrate-binding protein [Treponema sp.]|jgi:basic membrane protein A|nr:BMP family ABC transporter substrate-binding protein [Treponema sp.]